MKILFFFLLIPIFSFAQKAELSKFLTALKTPEFEESQKVITSLSLKEKTDYYTLKDFTIVSGLIFKTDIAGVNGYKSIIQANATNKAGTYKDARFLVVMYVDKTDKKWKVYTIREAVDPCEENDRYQRQIESGKIIATVKEGMATRCYWEILCGKLLAAKSSSDIVRKEIRKDPSDYFEYEDNKVLSKITGE